MSAEATAERDRIRAYTDTIGTAWDDAGHRFRRGPAYRPGDWRSTVSRWAEGGVELERLLVFVDQAQDKRQPWPWFCGVGWRLLRESGEGER
jgi:hypothetical protein